MAGEPTLQKGDGGEWVTYLQQCVNAVDPLTAIDETGQFDDPTEGKVIFFQGTVGLPETGVMDEATWERMHSWLAGDRGDGTGTQEGTSEAVSDGYDQNLALEVTVDLKPNGTVSLTAGNPAQRIAAKSQSFSARSIFADDSTHEGWFEMFPSEALDPGAYETLEFDYAYATVDHGDQTGARLSVYQGHIGYTIIGYDIVDGECRPTGEVSFQAEAPS